ncbi:MAG: toll/interleukin-1 receptor domain-containing protein [Pirellulaceae bacterium]
MEQRGRDVWFDKTEIKAGDDWRRAITDGIPRSPRVLSFLSKHSTRDPGVCRDEIAIAIGVKGGNIQTILVESEAKVQPPVNIGHIQWLDMHEWKERRATGEATWEEWYQAKLAEIIRVVESDERRRFAGEIETLHGHLKPIRSDARIYDLLRKGFFGRQWLFEAVEKWRQDAKRDSRLFWITGGPGVGKSEFAVQLAHTRSDALIAAQFVEWDKPDHRDARRVVRSIAFQLATRPHDYRKLLLTLPQIGELDRKDPAELIDYLLANPLRSVIGGGRARQLIVIDALDEAGEAARNPLVEMLARHAPRLPDWLGLVITSRPECTVKTPLQGLNPFVLDTRTEANRADLGDYLRHELTPHIQDRPDADRLIGQILEKSEGVFLYAERFRDDVQHGHLSLDRPEQFPQGLGGIFCQYSQRQFPDKEKHERKLEPALGAILAAREPLPVEMLQTLFGWRDTELRKWLRALGSLFPVTNTAGLRDGLPLAPPRVLRSS